MRCKFCNGFIGWQMSKSIKVVRCIVALEITVSEIVTFKVFDLQKVGQAHGV